MVDSSGPGVPLKQGAGLVVLRPGEQGGSDVEYYVLYDTKPLHPLSAVFPVALGRQLGQGLAKAVERVESREAKRRRAAAPAL